MPTISVIVPIFNSETTIVRCIESILAQTCDDFEIIVINDGSTDNGPSLVEALQRAHPSIRMISQPNKGLGAARNAGIKNARGAYIACVDGDDVIRPTMLEDMLLALDRHSADIAICQVANRTLSSDGRWMSGESFTIPGDEEWATANDALRLQLTGAVPFLFNSICFKLIRKSVFIDNQVWFPEGFRYSEDTPTSVMTFLHAEKVAYVRKDLYVYMHEGQSLTSTYSVKKARDICLNLEEIKGQLALHEADIPLDNFALGMIFPAVKNLLLAAPEDAEEKSDTWRALREWRRTYKPLKGASIPFAQWAKIQIGYRGLAPLTIKLMKHMRWLPFASKAM